MITVLLVEERDADREELARALAADPAIEVVATAADGERALELAISRRPDVVVMDWEMTPMDGLATTRRLMESEPRPVVLCSDRWSDDAASWAQVHAAGAVAAVRKPSAAPAEDFPRACRQLLRAVHRSAGVKLVRRWSRRGGESASPPPAARLPIRVVAIGVSTGGPPVLEAVLSRLPGDFPAPILVVQHIADGFVHGLVDWLRRVTPLRVQLAVDGEWAASGNVYIAPDGNHLGIDTGGHLRLDAAPPEQSQRPAVSYLFRSVARSFGGNAAAALLTGMGCDGAAELKALRDLRAVTIAQERRSCTVFGMPGEAIKLGAAQYVLAPAEIGELLRRVCAPRAAAPAPRPIAGAALSGSS
jgi:two-component system, chemotaxis family, protein-glutamate methylesterase/glutaminase